MSIWRLKFDRVQDNVAVPQVFVSVGVILTAFVAFLTGFICFSYISKNRLTDVGTALIISITISGLYFLLEYITIHSWEKPLLRIFLINFHFLFSALISILFISILFGDDISNFINSSGVYYETVGFAERLAVLKKILLEQPFARVFGILFFLMFLSLQALPLINSTIVKQKAEINQVKNASRKSINDLFTQQVNALSYIQHELGNKLPAVKSEFSYLKKLIATGPAGFNLSTKVRKPLDGEDPSKIDTVSDIINRIEEGLNYSTNSLHNAGTIISASKQQLHFEDVGLLEFLKDLCRKTISNRKQVEYHFSGDTNIYVKIDKEQFTTAINNIIANAFDHGFKKRLENNKIAFNVKSKKDRVELIIKNNGEPLQDDFTIEDFLTPHRHAGETGKTGLGGHFVGVILKKHNAEILLLPYEQDEEFKVKFLIILERV